MGIKVATVHDIPEGEARRFEVDGRWVAIANLGGGEFKAVDAICSHQHAWLDEGDVDVEDVTIECPLHGSTFSLTSGAATCLPATQPVAVYPVTVEGDDISVEIEVNA